MSMQGTAGVNHGNAEGPEGAEESALRSLSPEQGILALVNSSWSLKRQESSEPKHLRGLRASVALNDEHSAERTDNKREKSRVYYCARDSLLAYASGERKHCNWFSCQPDEVRIRCQFNLFVKNASVVHSEPYLIFKSCEYLSSLSAINWEYAELACLSSQTCE